MRTSNFSPQGGNVFQRIKEIRAKAEKQGIQIIDLSVGEPAGPALPIIRERIQEAFNDKTQAMYRYQDNDCHPMPDFVERFVQCHVETDLKNYPKGFFSTVPTLGTKSALQMIIEAMNSWSDGASPVHVCTMTNPGYGSPVVQSKMVRNTIHHHIPLDMSKRCLFDIEDLNGMNLPEGRTLIMINYPHNPTGVVADQGFMSILCDYCAERRYWLSADSAYTLITHTPNMSTLTDVAIMRNDLNWCEEFSASKAGNNTGLRTGAIIGSPEFVGDIKRVKGDIDSGFVAPVAIGILDAFENHMDKIMEVAATYSDRTEALIEAAEGAGLRLAVEPEGGFFVLFDAPKRAFGEDTPDAEAFNNLMINKTGVLGVPFGKWIRYAVCATDVLASIDAIRDGFAKADVSY